MAEILARWVSLAKLRANIGRIGTAALAVALVGLPGPENPDSRVSAKSGNHDARKRSLNELADGRADETDASL